jgi:hypothetical protein
MRQKICITIASLLLAALSIHRAHAQPPDWILMNANFDRQPITVTEISDGKLLYTQHNKPLTIGLNEVLALSSQQLTPGNAGVWLLQFNNGDRLFGQCGDLQNDTLHWNNPMLVALKFPIDQVQSISHGETLPPSEPRKEDRLALTNHDQVDGVVTGIDNGKISIQANSQITTIPLNNVDSVFFATTPATQAPPAEAYRITLRDQSRLTIHGLIIKDGKLSGQFPGATDLRRIKFEDVQAIEHLNGPVSWLSDRTPTSSQQAAFASDLSYPAQMDKNVFGGPLRFEAETFTKGIGVHAISKLVFPLDGTYHAFRTRYAIDTTGECNKADVNVRVLLDGKVAYEKQHVRAYQPPPLVSLDLGTAKTLTLEVTAGGPTDTQDRLNWLESALVREAPKPGQPNDISPTTKPTGPS